MSARFYEQGVTVRLANRRKLSAFLDTLVHKHLKQVKDIKLSYICCDDAYLLQINQQFLNHNTLTDIITFDMSEEKSELVGEIYISIERIKENAGKFGVRYQEELHRVIFHGALHLCGFKDKTETDRQEMRRQEDKCLKQYLKTEQQ